MAHPAVEVRIDPEAKKVYITIPETDNYPLLNDVIETLKESQIPYWIDINTIEKALESRLVNEPIVAATAKDGEVEVSIEKGEMEAYITLRQAYGGKAITVDDVNKMLSQHRIMFGIDYAEIEKAVSEGTCNKPILIAKGKKAIDGKDAVIEFMFKMSTTIHPKEIDHDMVDYRELQTVYSVKKDTVLAKKIPATQPENGITITRKTVQARKPKDVKMAVDKNTRFSSDGSEVLANIDGQPVLRGSTITVEPILEVNGDVNFSVGNIYFTGSLRITGSITSGFTVKATENIEIHGLVEDSYVEAGGDVLIKGGIQGKNKGTVKAGGNVKALFVQYGTIEAGKDILVGEVLHSNLSAGNKVYALAGRGQIYGGSISAQNLIEAKVIGSESNVRTELKVGFDPKEKKKLQDRKTEKAEKEASLIEVEKGLKILERQQQEGGLSAAKETLYHRLIATSEGLKQRIDDLNEEINALEETIERAAKPKIKAHKVIYPNVSLTIINSSLEVNSELTSAVLYEEEGLIIQGNA